MLGAFQIFALGIDIDMLIDQRVSDTSRNLQKDCQMFFWHVLEGIVYSLELMLLDIEYSSDISWPRGNLFAKGSGELYKQTKSFKEQLGMLLINRRLFFPSIETCSIL